MKDEIIDIHSHIVFGVDDGASLPEDSEDILIELYNQGVRKVVATPHRRKNMFDIDIRHIFRNFNNLQDIAKGVAKDLKVYLGTEVYYTEDVINKLSRGIIPTINDTDFVLLEFGKHENFNAIYLAANKIIMEGFIPILAHIERYEALEDIEKVKDLIELGCYTQVNSSHIIPKKLIGEKEEKEKKRAKRFLDSDVVHIVASDVHNMKKRRPYMDQAYEIITKRYGNERARKLFTTNPQKVINNIII